MELYFAAEGMKDSSEKMLYEERVSKWQDNTNAYAR